MSSPIQSLKDHHNLLGQTHLKDLLHNPARANTLLKSHEGLLLDLTHERITQETLQLLEKLAHDFQIPQKLKGLFSGQILNFTEKRAVLHTALRAPLHSSCHSAEMKQVLHDVHNVLEHIEKFSASVRGGSLLGASGKQLKNYVVVGIGGSYLSVEFVYNSLRQHPQCNARAEGKSLRFLANVDPIDFHLAIESKIFSDVGLDIEETLVIINSKTFTTAETMLNAKLFRAHLIEHYKIKHPQINSETVCNMHLCACSTNLAATSQFGIKEQNVFGFWDFVGGRFSVWSAIGVLPLSLVFGFDMVKQFLAGGHSMDRHLIETHDLKNNLPALMGLIGFYHSCIEGYSCRAIIPYCQALCKFAPHIQQLDMESNGKRVNSKGVPLSQDAAVVNFGEPGTNGQHSFFQLLHQGRTVPVEFIGFAKSQRNVKLPTESVSCHDELMSNFFSQPDALAIGKDRQELLKEGTPQSLIEHKLFPGNRPSLSLLFLEMLNPYTCGQLLALYEHRTSVEGFLWDVNSYDQYGVELGKVLAKKVRDIFAGKATTDDLNPATRSLIERYNASK